MTTRIKRLFFILLPALALMVVAAPASADDCSYELCSGAPCQLGCSWCTTECQGDPGYCCHYAYSTCGDYFANSICQLQDVVLFDDIYNGGGAFSTTSSMSFVGWDWNDRVSSVWNPYGRVVILYQHDNYGGASLTLTGSAEDLRWFPGPGGDGTWNDAVSSMLVF